MDVQQCAIVVREHWCFLPIGVQCLLFSEMDMQAQLQMNQSRIDDITIKEDLPKSNNMLFGSDFGVSALYFSMKQMTVLPFRRTISARRRR
jgi:hypothetical protein